MNINSGKKLILIILPILVIGGIGYYSIKIYKESGKQAVGPESAEKAVAPEKAAVLSKDDFSIKLLNSVSDWKENNLSSANKTEQRYGLLSMVINPETKSVAPTDYLLMSRRALNGQSVKVHIDNLKNSLSRTIGNIEFVSQRGEMINNHNGYFIEAKIDRPETKLRVLITLVEGDKDDIWMLSFNSAPEHWEQYKDSFYQSARSFQIAE